MRARAHKQARSTQAARAHARDAGRPACTPSHKHARTPARTHVRGRQLRIFKAFRLFKLLGKMSNLRKVRLDRCWAR